ncbi:hypothetical protein VZT92_013433 [Zoarces viviparus]|uniref:Uncharacterized protein n=1 Tax=Zoarces viviparus TaxID=48416 RepID=A0AAW1F498_ZOAVI
MEKTTDSESLLKTIEDAIRRRKDLMMALDTLNTTSVPKTRKREISQEQSTIPGYLESFQQTKKFLIQKVLRLRNYNMSEETEARVTSSGSEISTATEFADKDLQNEIPQTDNKESQAEAVQSSSELQKLDVLLENVEDGRQSLDSSSIWKEQNFQPHRPSLWKRFVRLFIPGWRRSYWSKETMVYVQPGSEPEKKPMRLTLQKR